MDLGYTIQKFFPAEPSGGIAYLKALASPLPAVSFCPTGGVDAKNAAAYLALDNVVCVGGSWVTPKDALASNDFAADREASARGVEARSASREARRRSTRSRSSARIARRWAIRISAIFSPSIPAASSAFR